MRYATREDLYAMGLVMAARYAAGVVSAEFAGETLETVLVDGTWRVVGLVSAEELEELERMHDRGDIRAEARLELLRHGRPTREPAIRLFNIPSAPLPAGTWRNKL